jgi:hypothetical protein
MISVHPKSSVTRNASELTVCVCFHNGTSNDLLFMEFALAASID